MRAILTALAVLTAFPAGAQECHDFDAIDGTLREQYSEKAIILAVNPDGAAFLFYGNPDTETWTLVLLNGTCTLVLSSGTGYEEIPALPGEAS